MRKLPQQVIGVNSAEALAINRNAFIHEAEKSLIEYSGIASMENVRGKIEVGKTVGIIRLQTFFDMRVRFYNSEIGADADIGRVWGDPWPADRGIVLDAKLTGGLGTLIYFPNIIVGNYDSPKRTAWIHYSLTNLEPVSGDLQLEITYTPLEH